MRLANIAVACLLAASLAGCESDPVTPETSVDAALEQLASGGISTYTTAAIGAQAGGVSVPVPATSSSSCAYDATTKFFVCAPVTASGLTFSRQFQLLDATGEPLSTANPLTIAAIRSVIDVEGTTTQGSPNAVTIEIDRHEDATLSGIQSTERVLNGSATQELAITGSGFSLTSNEASLTSNLLLPSTPAQKYPLGGTITTTGSSTFGSVATTTQDYQRVIAFDGSSLMTVTLTAGTATTVCKINLATPGTAPVCN